MPHRLLITGSTGLIGRRLLADRQTRGDVVVPLVRGEASADAIGWDPVTGSLDPAAVSGFDTVIHLAGEPLANGRWNAEKKRRILDSRVRGTRLLATALASAPQAPRLFISASGINFYGDRGDAILDESTARGSSFLSDVCQAWESAAEPLRGVCRVVHLRIGMVLTPDGGALAMMLPIFRFGLGGPIAGGRRYLSWVTMNDLVRTIAYAIDTDALQGPINVVSPEPVTGKVFTAALAAAVHRPAILGVPGWAVRQVMGEIADETVLCSIRAVPRRLIDAGFQFQDRAIATAIRNVLSG